MGSAHYSILLNCINYDHAVGVTEKSTEEQTTAACLTLRHKQGETTDSDRSLPERLHYQQLVEQGTLAPQVLLLILSRIMIATRNFLKSR